MRGKIKEALKDKKFLNDAFLEALECNNFKLIDKIITSIDDEKNLKILNDLLEKKILDMTNSEIPEKLSLIILNKTTEGENILHNIASQTSDQESLEALKNIIDKQKNTDFITHLLNSKNEKGKTPLDIARENNNKAFSDIFVKKPYTILSEIISSQKLIEKKVNRTSCVVM
jgi:transcriptional regulator of heat shock response